MNCKTKITKATFKSFVNKNREKLFVKVKSSFSGMTDCVEQVEDTFSPSKEDKHVEHSLGIAGVWLVGDSRDYFKAYEDDNFTGISCSNCCGSFIVAIKKQEVQ